MDSMKIKVMIYLYLNISALCNGKENIYEGCYLIQYKFNRMLLYFYQHQYHDHHKINKFWFNIFIKKYKINKLLQHTGIFCMHNI
jgi:hypothetical protein